MLRNNVISHSNGPTGMGIGFKEASGTLIESNEIIYCSLGIIGGSVTVSARHQDYREE